MATKTKKTKKRELTPEGRAAISKAVTKRWKAYRRAKKASAKAAKGARS